MAYTNTSAAAGAGLMDRLANLVKSTKEALQRRRVYNQTVSELRTTVHLNWSTATLRTVQAN